MQKRGGRSSKDIDQITLKGADETSSAMEKQEQDISETQETGSPEKECSTLAEEQSPKSPSPEPVYEEPVLTKLIVDSYEGEKSKGLYEGEGAADFSGGHQYQGQFSEGLMHGQGKYTWADGLIYEGEFTSNKVTGSGTYQWPDGSVYAGEVVDGLRHGFGTFTCPGGKMSYTGHWNQGKRHGKGRMNFDPDGTSFYEGDWVENNKHGWGTRQYPTGNVYQGMWFNNKRHGEGSMRWLDRDQMYTGQWENGIQHGIGQHIWFLHRVAGSQYPLRNMYDGEFVQSLRHGYGTFYYANGARYEGEWQNNMKHGRGKFIFKNGRVYEGIFEKDHIMEYPSFTMDGSSTPDLTEIRTRTPLPSEHMSIQSNDSRNTYGPSFQLEVNHLLEEFTETDREEEATQVIFVTMRHISNLRTIYTFYSQLGYEESPDNTYVMSRLQFWRFLKDCRLHHEDIMLTEMDRVLAVEKTPPEDIHNPYTKILFREFVNHMITLAYHIYESQHEGTSPLLAWCLSKLISDNIMKHACSVQGYIFGETRRAVNALVHMDQAYEVYKSFCTNRKHAPYEPTMKMRQFLLLLKDLKLINADLSAAAVISVLAYDDPSVADSEGCINLELEMTYLEFLEALVGCAQMFVTEAVVKDPATPRPSTTLTQDHSLMSVTATPSRMASQVGLEEGQDDLTGAALSPSHGAGLSEAGTPVPQAPSDVSQKTGGAKPPDVQQQHSAMTVGSGSEVREHVSHHTHPGSAKKSDIAVADQKKSASFVSTHSVATEGEHPLTQSVVSLGGPQSEAPLNDDVEAAEEEEETYEEEELDEQTRQFNFWTHQVHIFFVRKFFPAAKHGTILKNVLTNKYGDPRRPLSPPPPVETPVDDIGTTSEEALNGEGDTGHELGSVAEAEESESVKAD